MYEQSGVPYADLYDENYLHIPTLHSRIGTTIRLTEDAKLYCARVLWQGLPALANNCLINNAQDAGAGEMQDDLRNISKRMLCIAKHWEHPDEVESPDWLQTPFYWYYHKPNGDAVLLKAIELRVILKAELDLRRAVPRELLQYEINNCNLLYCLRFPILPPELKPFAMEATAQSPTRKRKHGSAESPVQPTDMELADAADLQNATSMTSNAVNENNIQMVSVAVDIEDPAVRENVSIPTPASYLNQHDYQQALLRRALEARHESQHGKMACDMVRERVADLWKKQKTLQSQKNPPCALNPILNRAKDNSQLHARMLTYLHYYEHYLRSDPRVQQRLALPPHNGNFEAMKKDSEFLLAVKAHFTLFYLDDASTTAE